MQRRWRPSAFLQLSILLHAGAIPALALWPRTWPWIAATVLLDHLGGVAAGIHPRSRLLGPNISRLHQQESAVGLTFDDGPDPEVTPAVLEMLRDRGVRASFFLIGQKAQQHSALTQRIAAEGHQIQNHSWSHSTGFWFHGPRRLAAEIDRTQELLHRLSGRTPRFFRAPAGVRSPLLEPILARRSLRLASWSRRGFDSVRNGAEAVRARLTRNLDPGAVLLLHDGNSARSQAGVPIVLEVLPGLLDDLERAGLKPQPLTPLQD